MFLFDNGFCCFAAKKTIMVYSGYLFLCLISEIKLLQTSLYKFFPLTNLIVINISCVNTKQHFCCALHLPNPNIFKDIHNLLYIFGLEKQPASLIHN